MLATQMDPVATRCRLAKQLVFTVGAGETWTDNFVKLIGIIEGTIGPKRNRYVHDQWKISAETIRRVDRRAKIAKPNAGQLPEIFFDTEHDVKTDDIEELITLTAIATTGLLAAWSDLDDQARLQSQDQEHSLLAILLHNLMLPHPHISIIEKPSQKPSRE